jgi:hypothetical protein
MNKNYNPEDSTTAQWKNTGTSGLEYGSAVL